MARWKRLVAVLALSLVLPGSGEACSLWAAAGGRVAGGGTLVAKNRDWRPRHRQVLRRVNPPGGYRYHGIFEEGRPEGGIKMGVNEHGLVVVSASPPHPDKVRRRLPRTRGLNGKLLASCRTVDEALARRALFLGPRFLLLADSTTIAQVEIGQEGHVDIQRKTDGVFGHTNHYVGLALRRFNRPWKTGRRFLGSRVRLARLHRLLAASPLHSPRSFRAIGDDREGGPDFSIWREGSSAMRSRTLATWVVHQPRGAPAVLWVRLRQPDGTVQEREIVLPSLWPRREGY